jgi:aspartate/methionine/tyrosine aminotransferase
LESKEFHCELVAFPRPADLYKAVAITTEFPFPDIRQGGLPVGMPLWFTKLLIRTRLARFSRRAQRLTEGGTQFLRYYSDRVLTAPVEELLDPCYVPDPSGPDVLDLNTPALRSDSGVSVGRFTADRRGHPPAAGDPGLRQAISDRYARLEGRSVDPNTQIVVTHGASGALAAALDAFVNPGQRVVLFDPCSPLFSLGAKSRRATLRWVPTWNEDGRCRYLAASFEKAMRGARLLILSNPVNPTGGWLADDDWDHIAWIAAAYDVLVYVDESFARFRFGENSRSLAQFAGANQRFLMAGSVTQEFGLGSLRVGWISGPRHLVRACGLTANLNAPYVPTVCQQAAARVLSECGDEVTKTLDRLRANSDFVVERLRSLGLEPVRPGGGLFVWVPVASLSLDGRTFAERLYREERVQVGPGCAFGPSGGSHIRISLAGDDGRLRAGLTRIAAFVERLRTPATPQPNLPPDSPETSEPHTPATQELPRPSFSRV